jgi:hypothetical protein
VVECERAETQLEQYVGLLASVAAPILVVRPTRGRDLAPDAERVTLEPLSLHESIELLDQVTDPVYRTAAHSLVDQVGGVPASIFELANALAVMPDAHVSVSLMSLLQTRLDALSPASRRVLAVAALAGERCWGGLLRELAGGAPAPSGTAGSGGQRATGEDASTSADVARAAAGADLAALRRSDILVREPTSTMPGEVEYRFRSELLRRAVLQMLPFGERPSVHLRIATWLEQNAPLAFAELAGEHFEKGGAPDAAYGHYLAAADEAELEEDFAAADRLFGKLATLAVADDLRAQAALAYGQAAVHRGDAALARRLLDEAATAVACCATDRRDLRDALARLREDTKLLGSDDERRVEVI